MKIVYQNKDTICFVKAPKVITQRVDIPKSAMNIWGNQAGLLLTY